MSVEFCVIKLGKMLDRAGHPGTPEPERLLSVAEAYSYCSRHGKTLADVASCMGDSMFIGVANLPNHDLLAEIADLKIARDDDAFRIADLQQRFAALTASNDRFREERDAAQAEANRVKSEFVEVSRKSVDLRSVADNAALVSDAPIAPSNVQPDHECLPSQIENAVEHEVAGDRPSGSVELNDAAWAEFESMAKSGRDKRTIARWLTQALGRIVSYANVSRWMRDRWSPQSGARFALRGMAGSVT